MTFLLGWLHLAAGALVNVAVFVAGRALAAPAGERLRLALRFERGPWASASAGRRVAFVVAGPAGCYLVASALFLTVTLVGGAPVTDLTSTRVLVTRGRPAASAGLRDGDRIVSVGGVPVPDWAHLREEISGHAGEPVMIEVMRGETAIALAATPDAGGKIGVGPWVEHRPVSVGRALASALAQPARINLEVIASFNRMLGGREKAEVSGPVGIVRFVGEASDSRTGAMQAVGAVDSYFLWVPAFVALVTFPWRRKGRAES